MNGLRPPVSDVEGKCDRCARDLGRRAPTLAVCRWVSSSAWAEGLRDHWELIGLGQRNRRPLEVQGTPRPTVPGRTLSGQTVMATPGMVHPRTRDKHPVTARRVELACRRCGARPRVARRRLYELAEQAVAAGRRDFYL
jgi:hypothetical protein